jgi:hypothetical protein
LETFQKKKGQKGYVMNHDEVKKNLLKLHDCAGGGKKRRMNSLDKILIRFFSVVSMAEKPIIKRFQNTKV